MCKNESYRMYVSKFMEYLIESVPHCTDKFTNIYINLLFQVFNDCKKIEIFFLEPTTFKVPPDVRNQFLKLSFLVLSLTSFDVKSA